MYVDSCKRLRIMKGSEAIGLGMCKTSQTVISTWLIYVNYFLLTIFEANAKFVLTLIHHQLQELWRSARTEAEVPQYSMRTLLKVLMMIQKKACISARENSCRVCSLDVSVLFDRI